MRQPRSDEHFEPHRCTAWLFQVDTGPLPDHCDLYECSRCGQRYAHDTAEETLSEVDR